MATLKNLPKICPSCGKRLSVHAMHCNGCQTHIEGNYSLPVMMQLSAPDQQFVLDFVKSSGSLKEMAHKLGLSYPTVRNRLDDIISQLNKFEYLVSANMKGWKSIVVFVICYVFVSVVNQLLIEYTK